MSYEKKTTLTSIYTFTARENGSHPKLLQQFTAKLFGVYNKKPTYFTNLRFSRSANLLHLANLKKKNVSSEDKKVHVFCVPYIYTQSEAMFGEQHLDRNTYI